jgi:hypothetical protein
MPSSLSASSIATRQPRPHNMKVSLSLFLLAMAPASAFRMGHPSSPHSPSLHASSAAAADPAAGTASNKKTVDPLLIRAARGEKTERTPVWMMRQAGRHIKEYRDLCKEYPTFRQRSEIPEVAVEVSLQPWRNYQTDGCILFSDILTPLPGMGCEFVIDEKLGPIMTPLRTYDDIKQVRLSLSTGVHVWRCRIVVVCVFETSSPLDAELTKSLYGWTDSLH